jgi:hypothetical protein
MAKAPIGLSRLCNLGVAKNISEAISLDADVFPGESLGLRIVERIAANSLEYYAFTVLGTQHNCLVLAGCPLPSELLFNFAAELLERSLLRAHLARV